MAPRSFRLLVLAPSFVAAFVAACGPPAARAPKPDPLIVVALDHGEARASWRAIPGRAIDPLGETAFDPMFVDDAIEQAVAVAKLGERTAALVEDARLVAPRRALSSALAAAEPNALVVDAAATATLRALDAVLLDALAQRSDRIGTFDCVGARLALAIALGDLDDALENAAATFAEDEHESERENDLDEERAETREAALDAWSTWRDEARVRGLDVVTATPVAVGATPPSNEAFVFPEVVTALARATSACAHKPPIRT